MVTGSGTGIGRATVEMLASRGAFVGVHYNRNADAAAATLEGIRKAGGNGVLTANDSDSVCGDSWRDGTTSNARWGTFHSSAMDDLGVEHPEEELARVLADRQTLEGGR